MPISNALTPPRVEHCIQSSLSAPDEQAIVSSGRMRRASSLDVAKLAGVSQSAVSRTFTPGAAVSNKTRARVMKAAERLHYRPNALASSLITKRSNMVALVIGDIENPFYAKIVNVFSVRLRSHGLHVLLFSLTGDDKVESALEEVLKYRVDGVMLVSAILSQQMADGCRRVGTPVVLYNRYAKGTTVSSVRVENYEGGRRAADFLVDAGHRRIAWIGGTRVDATSFDRENGFVGRLEERGVKPWKRVQGDYTFASGFDAARKLLTPKQRPDAIFAVSDLMALGFMEAARGEFGLRVPEDVSVVGFDDIPMASWPSYELTTVRQPVEDMVDAALSLLIDQIENPDQPPITRLLPGELQVRKSSRTP